MRGDLRVIFITRPAHCLFVTKTRGSMLVSQHENIAYYSLFVKSRLLRPCHLWRCTSRCALRRVAVSGRCVGKIVHQLILSLQDGRAICQSDRDLVHTSAARQVQSSLWSIHNRRDYQVAHASLTFLVIHRIATLVIYSSKPPARYDSKR